MQTYLKEESYYTDLYDLGTIESCLESFERWQKLLQEKFDDEGIKNLSKEERIKGFSQYSNIELYTIKGQRYNRKASTIKEWIESDRKFDEKLKKTEEPKNICCLNCSEKMTAVFKDLYNFPNEPLQVLFFFECPNCKKRKGIYDNGEERVPQPDKCSQCSGDIKNSFKREGKIDTWTKICSSCGFTETEIEDIGKKEAEREARRLRQEELLKKYRSEFCLSESEGQEYIEAMWRVESLLELLKKEKDKRTDPDYQKAVKLKNMTIIEVEKLLCEILDKQKYIKLVLEKPIISRFIIVPFTVQDADSGREKNDSVRKLQKLIKKTLDGTNWRLMSEGVYYKLGYLAGRLKGCDQEEDLMQMVKSDE